MRYTVPEGRDAAPYAKWHKESVFWLWATMSIGLIYPAFMLMLAYLFGGPGSADDIFMYLWVAFAAAIPLSMLQFEVQAKYMQGKAVRGGLSRVEKIVDEVCKEAGVDWRPLVLVLPFKQPNAAATHSFSMGRKLVIFKGILALGDNELKAVIAHEVAHILHKDIRTLLMVSLIQKSMNMVLLLLYVTTLCLIMYDWNFGWYLAVIFLGISLLRLKPLGIALWGYIVAMPYLPPEYLFMVHGLDNTSLWFLLPAWFFTLVFLVIWYLLYAGHSRRREYLADAGAVAITGWENRIHLGTALHFLANKIGGFEGIDEDAGKPDWFKQHPTVGKRLQAMEIDEHELVIASGLAALVRESRRQKVFKRLFKGFSALMLKHLHIV